MYLDVEVDITTEVYVNVEDVFDSMTLEEKNSMRELLSVKEIDVFSNEVLRDREFIKDFIYSMIFVDSTELPYLIEQLKVNKIIE